MNDIFFQIYSRKRKNHLIHEGCYAKMLVSEAVGNE